MTWLIYEQDVVNIRAIWAECRVGKCWNFIAPVERSPCIKYKLVITFDTIMLKNVADCRSNCRSREHAFQSPSRTAYKNTQSQKTSLLCLAITVT